MATWGGWLLCAVALVAAAIFPDHAFFFIVYLSPLPPTGALWLRLRFRTLDRLTDQEILLDLSTFGLAALRSAGGWGIIPYSGHMVFLTYSILRTPQLGYRLLAAALLLMTTAYKFRISHDISGWVVGLALGMGLAGLASWLRRRGGVA